jgi:formylglycine-generating enzyme required for sulfatase activity
VRTSDGLDSAAERRSPDAPSADGSEVDAFADTADAVSEDAAGAPDAYEDIAPRDEGAQDRNDGPNAPDVDSGVDAPGLDAPTLDAPDAEVPEADAVVESDASAPDDGPEPIDLDASNEATAETGPDVSTIDAPDDGDAGEPRFDNPSCVGLSATCGSANNQDCCHRSTIPGGTFFRSYDGVGFTDTSYPATVSSLTLDTFEVTVGRFRAFVAAGFGTQAKPPAAGSGALGGTPASGWSSSDNGNLAANTAALTTGLKCSAPFQTWTDTPSSNETRPINCVTWYEAFAFCIWDGARLPTEAEWNYAASGGNQQRVYPWSVPSTSSSISDTNASYWVDPTNQCLGDGVSGCTLGDLVPVGSKPAGRGRFGHADMGGNVWEWARDTFDNPYPNGTCSDCVDISKGTLKVIRGGSFFGTSSTLLTSGRSQGAAATRYYTVGIRCAR